MKGGRAAGGGASSFRFFLAVYRCALFLYPREFRQRFGEDLAADLAEALAAAGAERPCAGRLAVWRLTILDLARSIPREHLARRARRRALRRSLAAAATPGDPMGTLWLDLRHAARGLAKAPGFTLVAVGLLGLAIGANTATFSLARAVLRAPAAFEEPDRLVALSEGFPRANMPRVGFSPPDYLDLASYDASYAAVGAFVVDRMELSGAGEPEQVDVARASASLFPLLGVEPALGRWIGPEEDAPEAEPVAVLSFAAWKRWFGGSADVVGRAVTLNRRPHVVVGVLPASATFPPRGIERNGRPAAVFIPLAFTETERQGRGMRYRHSVVARLAPGVSLERAASELPVLARRLHEGYPAGYAGTPYLPVLVSQPFAEAILGEVELPLLLLTGAVGLVLLAACANVANLLLTRALGRRQQLAVRTALGASRLRLARMLLAESLLLAAGGGALGLLLAQGTVALVPALEAAQFPLSSPPRTDLPALAFCFAATLAAALVAGVAPAVSGAGDRAEPALRAEGAGARGSVGGGRRRLQQALVAGGVAVACVLLVGSGLLVRSLGRLLETDPGFRPAQALAMSFTLPIEAYPEAAGVYEAARALQGEAAELPGVESAALATALPMSFGERRAFFGEGAAPDAPTISPSVTWTLGPYFQALGIPLVAGRVFTDGDDARGGSVALVSRALAARYWPGEDAVGKRIKWGGEGSPSPWKTVVGVVGDVYDRPLGDEPNIHVYIPYLQLHPAELDMAAQARSTFQRELHLALSAEGDPTVLAGPALAAIRRLDPRLAVARIETLDQAVARGVAPQRFSATLLGGFAGGALALAAIGLYGLLALQAAQRTREIGLRIALGARRGAVVRQIVGRGLAVTAVGLAVGLAGALGAARLLGTLLYEVDPLDPLTFAAVPLLLLAVALLACYAPARRAASVDPLTALKGE